MSMPFIVSRVQKTDNNCFESYLKDEQVLCLCSVAVLLLDHPSWDKENMWASLLNKEK